MTDAILRETGKETRRALLAVLVVGATAAVWAKEVTLTVNSDAGIAAQLTAEGKSIADGDTLVKDGAATLTMDEANGALLKGGTVKAGMLSVQPANGLGKAGADWTIEDDATIRIGGAVPYNGSITFRMSGTGVDGAGALAVYNANYQAISTCEFYLEADATMCIHSGGTGSGVFTQGRFHFGGHTLTLKGGVSGAAVRQRFGGQVHDNGTLVLDGVHYTSGAVSESGFVVYDGERTIKLVNGSSYRINVQKQLDAFGTYDGAKGTTLQTDSGTLATVTFKNLTGSPTLDASFLAVTVNGTLTARGMDLAAGTCLDCRQAVTLDNGATFDLVDDETIAGGQEYAVATATGGFVGQLPRLVGRAYRRQTTLRFSDDRKTLYATFGEMPEKKDYGDVTAWYRFDDVAVGTALGHGTPIFNEVDLSLGRGKVQLLDKTEVATTGIAPQTALPPEMTEVYDPLTGVTFTNRASLSFSTEAYGAGSTKGAEILISSDPSNRLQGRSVTLEAFICATGGVYNLMAPIVSIAGTGEVVGESLALLVNAGGFICARFRSADMANAIIWDHTRMAGAQLFDGRWHHVALVYDQTSGKVRKFVDYRLDNEMDADTSGLKYSDDEAKIKVYIGGYGSQDGRKFNGCIDEVRITGAALTPETFLRRRCRTSASGEGLVDERTLLFVPMDGGAPGATELENVNYSTNTPSAHVSRSSREAPAFDVDAPSKGVRGTHRRAASIATGSLNVGGASGSADTVVVQDGYYDYFADSFTIEGSFKTSSSSDSTTILSLVSPSSYVVKLMVMEGNRFYLASQTPTWHGNMASTDPVNDDKWHRFRFFFDHEARTFNLYLDDVLTRTFSSDAVMLPLPSETRVIIGGVIIGGSVTVSQAFTGKIGPVRISRGKLKPHEWLSEVDPDEADPTMRDGIIFHLRGQTADGLLDVAPYPSSRKPGEGEALSVSGATVPTFTENVRKPQYYLYGKEDGLVATNTGSIHLQNSAMIFRGQRAIDTYPQTVECLAKFTSIGSKAHLFRLAMTESASAESTSVRVVCFAENGHLRFGFTTKKSDSEYGDAYANTSIQISELIGGWHHLAFSFDEDPVAGTTTLRSYLDYQLRDELKLNFTIWHSTVLMSHSFTIGRPGNAATEGLVGDIDEFRITEGVLQPEEFISKVPSNLGLLLFVR